MSVRGSDPDAALYYLCRMLDAGEDPLYLARRVVRMAVEDIGLADPQALVICNAARTPTISSGLPEGELAIAQAVIISRPRPSRTPPTSPGAAMRTAKEAGCCCRQAHPQRPDQPDEIRLRPGYDYDHDARRPSPARTTSPKRSAARNSTTRPSVASSARSGSGWNIGRSLGRSAAIVDNDRRRSPSPLFPRLHEFQNLVGEQPIRGIDRVAR
jgi:replication-associated recombination protein RarA